MRVFLTEKRKQHTQGPPHIVRVSSHTLPTKSFSPLLCSQSPTHFLPLRCWLLLASDLSDLHRVNQGESGTPEKCLDLHDSASAAPIDCACVLVCSLFGASAMSLFLLIFSKDSGSSRGSCTFNCFLKVVLQKPPVSLQVPGDVEQKGSSFY